MAFPTRLLSVTLLLAACAAPAPLPTEPNPTEATSARVAKEPPRLLEFVGVVTSRRSSTISALVSGPVVKLNIHSGQLVRAGDLVIQLDDTDLRNKLSEADSNEKSARMAAGAYGASASAASQTVAAESHLNRLGGSSRMALNNARAELAKVNAEGASASAKAQAARSELKQAEANLARAQIFAPIDGIVTNIKAHVGDAVQIGAPLARVFDPSNLIIRFSVPKEHRGRIKLGQRVELSLDDDSQVVRATVSNISEAQEPPINFTVVEADIDDTTLARSELTVASVGRVRIADARGAKR